MNLEIQSRLSFYRRLEEVEHKKGIFLVRHIETGQIYVEKMTNLYMIGYSNQNSLTFHRFMNVWKRMVRYI